LTYDGAIRLDAAMIFPQLRKCIAVGVILFFSLTGPVAFSASSRGPSFKKVLVVVLENTNYSDALKQPDLAALASEGALLTRFHAERHPSQPNYIAMVSGDTHGVDKNDPVDLDAKHVGDLLDSKKRSWKAYLEGYPGNCFKGERSGHYVRKHNPLISFKSVSGSSRNCSRLVPAEQLERDVRSGTLPDFAVYVPDLRNDGHDTGIDFAGRWLSKSLLPILRGPLSKDLLLVVTFDESGSSRDENQIFSVLLGAGVRPGARSDTRYDHYSLLRTIEDRFQMGTLGKNDKTAEPIRGIWG
jgi:hypothetical protein